MRKTVFAGLVAAAMLAAASAAQAAPAASLPAGVAADHGAVTQVRWGHGWGYRHWGYRGWGYRGWGYRRWGYGSSPLALLVGQRLSALPLVVSPHRT